MDLTTQYLGLTLRSPLVASAGPLTGTVASIARLDAAGIGAVVLPSLFEEQVRAEAERDTRLADACADSHPEAFGYLPGHQRGPAAEHGRRPYLDLIERAVEQTSVPVIASLNGVSPGGWTDYASAIQQAGAAAIELNIYYLPGDPLIPARDAERRYAEILTTVKAVVSIPVAVKLSPYFSSLGEMAAVLAHAGADGLVLFNRFMQTDIDPETFTVSSGFRLSIPAEAALPRAWISRLCGRIHCSLAASTGVETGANVASYLLAGADVVMSTSALLRHGPDHARVLLDELRDWMERKGFTSLTDVRGLLAKSAQDEPAYGRVGYLSAIEQGTNVYAEHVRAMHGLSARPDHPDLARRARRPCLRGPVFGHADAGEQEAVGRLAEQRGHLAVQEGHP
jgi:dihydroorotate dehydrogenase (fumarate)